MAWSGGRLSVRVLLACVALLLPAGVLVATRAGPATPTADARVGAASLALDGVPEEPAASRSAGAGAVVPTIATLPTPITTSVPVTTTAHRGTVPTSTTTPAPNGRVTPPLPGSWVPPVPTTGIPSIPAASSWSADGDGVGVRLRMEPAAPVAGETVRFSIDISTARGCCVVHLDFGDGSEPTSRGGNCTAGLAGTTIVATHTYAAPGAYTGRLIVASIPCQAVPVLPGEPPASPGMIYGPVIATCVAVGPGTPAKAGC